MHHVVAVAADEGHVALVAAQYVIAAVAEQPVALGVGQQRITEGIAVERMTVAGQFVAVEQAVAGDGPGDVPGAPP
ncbi:hypothetical protein D9M72_632910 [compost metagenome]